MIKFDKLVLHNTFAYEHLEFDFTKGIHSIGGVNGASKTSIYLAVAQCLFNKNPKGTKIDDVSNYITKRPYEITVSFYKDEDYYVVTNSKVTGKITIACNGKDISKSTIPQNLNTIKDILDDQYETFVGMTYQATDSSLDLVDDPTDTARKNFVNKILKFTELDSKLAEAKEKLKSVKAKIAGVDSLVSRYKESMLKERELPEVYADGIDLVKVERLKSKLEDNQAALVEVNTKIAVRTSMQEAFETHAKNQLRIKAIKDELDTFKCTMGGLDEALAALDRLKKEQVEVNTAYKRHLQAIKDNTEPELVCSRCGQEVAAKEALAQYNDRKQKLEADTEPLWVQVKWYERYVSAYTEEVTTQTRRARLEEELSRLDHTPAPKGIEGTSLEKLIKARDALSVLVLEDKTELADITKKIELANRASIERELTAKYNEEAVAHNERVATKVKELEGEREELFKRLDLLENWVKILGPNGYRVHKMNNFIQLLNNTMSKYTNLITSGRIQCNFYVEDSGKIEFKVTDADKTIPFQNWSNGEKARVKLACLFSVIELLETMGSACYNILFLDEIFASLDEEGREGLFNVLNTLKESGKCVYTVSHHHIANQTLFDTDIYVDKSNGISFVR